MGTISEIWILFSWVRGERIDFAQTAKGSFKGFGVMYFKLSYYTLRFNIEAAFTDILHIKILALQQVGYS